MPKQIIKNIADIVLKILVILTIILWIIWIIKPSLVIYLIDQLKDVIKWLWYLNYIIVFLSSMIESLPIIWVVIPGQNILIISWWFYAKTSNFALILIIFLSSLWALIWNYIWYFIWKVMWDNFFAKYWLWFWVTETDVKYLKESMPKWWPFWIILWKFHSVARAFIPFIAWSSWMHKKFFMLYNAIWSVIRWTTMVLIWILFADYYEIILKYLWWIILALLVWFIFYMYKFKKDAFMKYMEEKNAEIEKKFEKK